MRECPSSKQRAPVRVFANGRPGPPRSDRLATEEPMEMRIIAVGRRFNVYSGESRIAGASVPSVR